MRDQRAWLVGMAVMFVLGVAGVGSGVYYQMEASDQRERADAAVAEAEKVSELLAASDAEKLSLQEKLAKQSKELSALRGELSGKDDEMKAQRERMGQDMNEKLATERQRQRELRNQLQTNDGNGGRGRRRMVDLEKMKTEDPERYQQMMNRRKQMETRMKEQRDRRAAVVSAIDTSKLNAAQRGAVERYQELTSQMGQIWENMSQMSPEEREVQMRSNRENMREMMDLQTQVRDVVLEQAVKNGDTEGAKEAMQMFGGAGGGPRGGGPGGPPPGEF